MRKFVWLGREPTLVKSPAQASRVRSAFAIRMEFFEAKHVGTFNASAARQRIFCRERRTFLWSMRKHTKRKSVDSFNAKNPRQPGEFFIGKNLFTSAKLHLAN